MPEHTNQQLHIVICDDESIDRQQAADLTREIMAAEGLACSLSGYESATALLAAICHQQGPYLDLQRFLGGHGRQQRKCYRRQRGNRDHHRHYDGRSIYCNLCGYRQLNGGEGGGQGGDHGGPGGA